MRLARSAVVLGVLTGCTAAGGTTRANSGESVVPARTFTNPIITSQSAGDPWVIRHGDHYYFTATLDPEEGLSVWKSPTLTGLDAGDKVRVWTAPPSGPLSSQIWAPELYRFGDRWYLYFTASDGVDANHRHYVLESETDDPQGRYKDPVLVHPAFDQYAIDGSILEMPDGRLYWMYAAGGLFIAPMSSPTRADGPGVKFAEGSEEWEHGWRMEGSRWVQDPGYWIEAPQALVRNGRVFVVYSAGHTATPHYYLGLLTLTGDDPMDPGAWTKHPEPVFAPYRGAEGSVFTTGHNSFTKSPDGTEDWIVYHGKDEPWGVRQARTQRFTWNADGSPNFGRPVPRGVELRVPSGEISQ